MWGHLTLKPEDYKRVSEISLERDWSWVSIDNPRLFGNHDVRLTGGGWALTRWGCQSVVNITS